MVSDGFLLFFGGECLVLVEMLLGCSVPSLMTEDGASTPIRDLSRGCTLTVVEFRIINVAIK